MPRGRIGIPVLTTLTRRLAEGPQSLPRPAGIAVQREGVGQAGLADAQAGRSGGVAVAVGEVGEGDGAVVEALGQRVRRRGQRHRHLGAAAGGEQARPVDNGEPGHVVRHGVRDDRAPAVLEGVDGARRGEGTALITLGEKAA